MLGSKLEIVGHLAQKNFTQLDPVLAVVAHHQSLKVAPAAHEARRALIHLLGDCGNLEKCHRHVPTSRIERVSFSGCNRLEHFISRALFSPVQE